MQAIAPVAYDIDRDPLLAYMELPWKATVFPLGFPAGIETNSEIVLACVRNSWSEFEQLFDADAVRLNVIVQGTANGSSVPPPKFRCREQMLTVVANADNYAGCDLEAGFACAYITPAAELDPNYLREAFTDALLLSMIHAWHLSAVHAACVEKNGAGFLLCGESGAGKSSLAFACALRGWKLICDDASFLVRAVGGKTIVGNPYLLRFKPDGPELFPELAGRSTVPRLSGKSTIYLQTKELPTIATSTWSDAQVVVFLRRTATGAAKLIRRIGPFIEELRTPEYGPHDAIAEQRATLGNLADLPAYELHYSSLWDAVACLNEFAQGFRERAQ